MGKYIAGGLCLVATVMTGDTQFIHDAIVITWVITLLNEKGT